jgi:predicted branched-subunit amino acid permease
LSALLSHLDLAITAPFSIIMLALIRNKKTGRTALYGCAIFLQRALWVLAAILPAMARFIEGLPDALLAAWQIERPRRQEEEHSAVRGLGKVVGM